MHTPFSRMRTGAALHEGQYYWYLICRFIKLLGCYAVFGNLSTIRTIAANLLTRLMQVSINLSIQLHTYINILTHTLVVLAMQLSAHKSSICNLWQVINQVSDSCRCIPSRLATERAL